ISKSKSKKQSTRSNNQKITKNELIDIADQENGADEMGGYDELSTNKVLKERSLNEMKKDETPTIEKIPDPERVIKQQKTNASEVLLYATFAAYIESLLTKIKETQCAQQLQYFYQVQQIQKL
ncbi:hypothetical protein RFI_25717, partial [Reticulomyxa filosa]